MSEEDGDDNIIIETLPVGTRISWLDNAGRPHKAEVVAWPDRPVMAEGVRVIETIVSEVPHILPPRRRVKVI
jgi:hypothetical protein